MSLLRRHLYCFQCNSRYYSALPRGASCVFKRGSQQDVHSECLLLRKNPLRSASQYRCPYYACQYSLLLVRPEPRDTLQVPNSLPHRDPSLLCRRCLHPHHLCCFLRQEACSVSDPNSTCTLHVAVRVLRELGLHALLVDAIQLDLLLQIRFPSNDTQRIRRPSYRMHGGSHRQNEPL